LIEDFLNEIIEKPKEEEKKFEPIEKVE